MPRALSPTWLLAMRRSLIPPKAVLLISTAHQRHHGRANCQEGWSHFSHRTHAPQQTPSTRLYLALVGPWNALLESFCSKMIAHEDEPVPGSKETRRRSDKEIQKLISCQESKARQGVLGTCTVAPRNPSQHHQRHAQHPSFPHCTGTRARFLLSLSSGGHQGCSLTSRAGQTDVSV